MKKIKDIAWLVLLVVELGALAWFFTTLIYVIGDKLSRYFLLLYLIFCVIIFIFVSREAIINLTRKSKK